MTAKFQRQVEAALKEFVADAALSGGLLRERDLELQFQLAPHQPPSKLPATKMAVFGFWAGDMWLKLSYAGPKSHARYASQHYRAGSAPSTLAADLADDTQMLLASGFSPSAAGEWLKLSAHRFNVFVPADRPVSVLRDLKAFLNDRLKPRYGR